MLKLRKFNKSDIMIFKKWLNQEYVLKWYKEPEVWIHEVSSIEFSWVAHFIVECDGKPIGFCQYYEYEKGKETWHKNIPMKNTYSIDYLIGEPKFLKKGFGTKIIVALKNVVFRETDAKRIIVKPEIENESSCRALLSSGFIYDKFNQVYIFLQ